MHDHPTPIDVDIISDVVCPWCPIGYYQLEAAARETGIPVAVRWHPFELNPQLGPEGANQCEHLMAKYQLTREEVAANRERLTELGAELGFAYRYTDDMRVWNSFRAHQLIEFAAECDRAHETSLRLFRAFFTDRQNIGSIPVLVAIAEELGLDGTAFQAELERDARAEAVRIKAGFWTERGIRGVPTMAFANRYLVSGAQGTTRYAAFLREFATPRAA